MAKASHFSSGDIQMISERRSIASYFERCMDAVEAHAGKHRLIRDYKIAGKHVSLCFTNPQLEKQLSSALQHLASPPLLNPALVVYLASANGAGGIDLPAPDWNSLRFFERGNLRAYSDNEFSLIYNHRIGVFNAVNHRTNTAIYWARTETLPYYERSAPLRHLLQAMMQRHGVFVTHASAVGLADGGVLIAGRTGSGKSTTAVVCLRSELLYAGDDYILTEAEPNPHIYSLYSSAKVNTATMHWIPEWQSSVSNSSSLSVEKALIFVSQTRPEKCVSGFPLRAIVLPRVTTQATTMVRSVSGNEAFRAIVPDTVFTILGDVPRMMAIYKQLTQQLPCYRVELGTDLAQIPLAILNILSRS